MKWINDVMLIFLRIISDAHEMDFPLNSEKFHLKHDGWKNLATWNILLLSPMETTPTPGKFTDTDSDTATLDTTILGTLFLVTQLVWDADEVKPTISPWQMVGTHSLALMSEPL